MGSPVALKEPLVRNETRRTEKERSSRRRSRSLSRTRSHSRSSRKATSVQPLRRDASSMMTRRRKVYFADKPQVRIIPMFDEELRPILFYAKHEIRMMKEEALGTNAPKEAASSQPVKKHLIHTDIDLTTTYMDHSGTTVTMKPGASSAATQASTHASTAASSVAVTSSKLQKEKAAPQGSGDARNMGSSARSRATEVAAPKASSSSSKASPSSKQPTSQHPQNKTGRSSPVHAQKSSKAERSRAPVEQPRSKSSRSASEPPSKTTSMPSSKSKESRTDADIKVLREKNRKSDRTKDASSSSSRSRESKRIETTVPPMKLNGQAPQKSDSNKKVDEQHRSHSTKASSRKESTKKSSNPGGKSKSTRRASVHPVPVRSKEAPRPPTSQVNRYTIAPPIALDRKYLATRSRSVCQSARARSKEPRKATKQEHRRDSKVVHKASKDAIVVKRRSQSIGRTREPSPKKPMDRPPKAPSRHCISPPKTVRPAAMLVERVAI